MKPNIKDISLATGFSVATVSNVLNNKKNVSKKTSEKVLQAAREIGYLKMTRIEEIRLIMYKKTGEVLTDTPFIDALIDGMESEAKENNLSIVLCTLKENDPDFDSKLSDILLSRNSGVILLATEMTSRDLLPFKPIQDRMVVVDAAFWDLSFDSVLMNNSESFYGCVKYLYEHNHRRIGLLESTIEIQNFKDRKRGFLNAMTDLQLPLNDDFLIKVHPTMLGAYQDMLSFLSERPVLPTAFCAINDIIAVGAMRALIEQGYRIPEDISIIGFDNMPFSNMTFPGLTTINIQKKEMGQVAVKRLLTKLDGSYSYPMTIQLHTSLVERGSVKKIDE